MRPLRRFGVGAALVAPDDDPVASDRLESIGRAVGALLVEARAPSPEAGVRRSFDRSPMGCMRCWPSSLETGPIGRSGVDGAGRRPPSEPRCGYCASYSCLRSGLIAFCRARPARGGAPLEGGWLAGAMFARCGVPMDGRDLSSRATLWLSASSGGLTIAAPSIGTWVSTPWRSSAAFMSGGRGRPCVMSAPTASRNACGSTPAHASVCSADRLLCPRVGAGRDGEALGAALRGGLGEWLAVGAPWVARLREPPRLPSAAPREPSIERFLAFDVP